MDKTPSPSPDHIAAAAFGGAGPAGSTPGMKLSNLALLVSGPQPRRSSTPLTKGHYWDVSPGDLKGIGGVVVDAKQGTEVAVDEEEEDDEIEYMPPYGCRRDWRGPELPYEPPFEMLDYKATGRALFALGHGGLVDDTADVYYLMDIEQQLNMKQLVADAGFSSDLRDDSARLQLPELEDDSPFHAQANPAQARPQAYLKPPDLRPPFPLSERPPGVRSRLVPVHSAYRASQTSDDSPPNQSLLQLRRPKAAAASAFAGAGADRSAAMAKVTPVLIAVALGQAATMRPIASISSNTNSHSMRAVPVAQTKLSKSKSKSKSKSEAQAPAPTHAQAKVQAQAQAPRALGQTRLIA
ncbi:hypothetical protein V8D89_009121 [Ganoderma adspersum]